MKIIIKVLSFALASAFSLQAIADVQNAAEQASSTKTSVVEQQSPEVKHWSFGAGVQTLTVTNDVKDFDFSGSTIAVSYAFKNWMLVRASFHSLENDDESSLESESYDVSALFGTGLQRNGFKAYGGIGYYSDTWSFDVYEDEDFSGFTLTGGLGYNWEYVALDFLVGVRSVSDYEDFTEEAGLYGDIVAVTTSLTLSGRF